MDLSKLRILFVHSGSDLYGASRSLLRLSSRLVRNGALVKVVLPSEGPLVPALKESGVAVVIQTTLSVIERRRVGKAAGLVVFLLNIFFSTLGLLRIIGQFRPHVIHTMTSVVVSSGLSAWIAGIPHVWHIRESFGEFGIFWRYYRKYILHFSSGIICVSTPVAEQFGRYEELGKIHVIHNGFPIREFADVDANRIQEFKSKYIGKETGCLVGVVGRIKFQRKGQDVFVKAAALLRDKFPDTRFLCVGSPFPGNEIHLENLRNLIERLALDDCVTCTGDVEDVKAAIASLDILVLPSAQPEPFGGVVVEAMALSRPVVATRIGGSVEQVVDGVTGYLVEPNDPASLACAIENLLLSSDRRRTFGKNGYARFLEKFEFESFYLNILEIYKQVFKDEMTGTL